MLEIFASALGVSFAYFVLVTSFLAWYSLQLSGVSLSGSYERAFGFFIRSFFVIGSILLEVPVLLILVWFLSSLEMLLRIPIKVAPHLPFFREVSIKVIRPSVWAFISAIEENFKEIEHLSGESIVILDKRGDEIRRYVPLADRDLPESEQGWILMEPCSLQIVAQETDKMLKFSRGEVSQIANSSTELILTVQQIRDWGNFAVRREDGSIEQIEFDPRSPAISFQKLSFDLRAEISKVFGQGGYSKVAEREYAKRLRRLAEDEEGDAHDLEDNPLDALFREKQTPSEVPV